MGSRVLTEKQMHANILDMASEHDVGCGTVAGLRQGMEEECCGSEPSHHQGVFWQMPKEKPTMLEQQLSV